MHFSFMSMSSNERLKDTHFVQLLGTGEKKILFSSGPVLRLPPENARWIKLWSDPECVKSQVLRVHSGEYGVRGCADGVSLPLSRSRTTRERFSRRDSEGKSIARLQKKSIAGPPTPSRPVVSRHPDVR
jgi:hypothetical protein